MRHTEGPHCGQRWGVPRWELLVHTPAVFVRVASKGVAGYGRWKNIRKTGYRGRRDPSSRDARQSVRKMGDEGKRRQKEPVSLRGDEECAERKTAEWSGGEAD